MFKIVLYQLTVFETTAGTPPGWVALPLQVRTTCASYVRSRQPTAVSTKIFRAILPAVVAVRASRTPLRSFFTTVINTVWVTTIIQRNPYARDRRLLGPT